VYHLYVCLCVCVYQSSKTQTQHKRHTQNNSFLQQGTTVIKPPDLSASPLKNNKNNNNFFLVHTLEYTLFVSFLLVTPLVVLQTFLEKFQSRTTCISRRLFVVVVVVVVVVVTAG